jgi:protein-L-isoaspartate(D-aspartate) O-methyltransferase
MSKEQLTNMIYNQIRPWEVTDQVVLKQMMVVPRELFVPETYHDLAFADMAIPLGHGQVMLTPKEVGRILQDLNIQTDETILEIGTGSGYMTALLAGLGQRIDSIDIFSDFSVAAQLKLAKLKINNVNLITADAAHGWDKQSYDVIVITGSLPSLPNQFRLSLNPGGRLFAIIGQTPAMEAVLLTYTLRGQWHEQKLFETVVPPLLNVKEPSQFVF